MTAVLLITASRLAHFTLRTALCGISPFTLLSGLHHLGSVEPKHLDGFTSLIPHSYLVVSVLSNPSFFALLCIHFTEVGILVKEYLNGPEVKPSPTSSSPRTAFEGLLTHAASCYWEPNCNHNHDCPLTERTVLTDSLQRTPQVRLTVALKTTVRSWCHSTHLCAYTA